MGERCYFCEKIIEGETYYITNYSLCAVCSFKLDKIFKGIKLDKIFKGITQQITKGGSK